MSDIQVLAEQHYLRERLSPKRGDVLYLHLSDLRQTLEEVAALKPSKVFDYGCGGSPYRSLFPDAVYHRADLPGLEGLDYIISDDSSVAAPSESYDLVLSTQVLEHVPDPRAYLKECLRLLKPGGYLMCSTHGTFEDHACPHDYWRWTAEGLHRTITAEGFDVKKHYKLSTGPRALIFLIERAMQHVHIPKWNKLELALRPIRWLLSRQRAELHRLCDAYFSANTIVERGADDGSHVYYICILSLAQKPA